jgi:outer membrane protein OmpA-like peptidoglycan-associated protein
MRRFTFAGVWLIAAGAAANWVAAGEQDCSLGAQYLAAAHASDAAGEHEEAAARAGRAIAVCPSYDAYELQGESLAHSMHRADQAAAVDALVSAHELASSDRERSRSLYEYARLLNRNNDPQNAYPLITSAKALDPANEEIMSLADQIEHRIEHPTVADIRGGMWDSFYKPLRMASAGARAAAGSAFAKPGSAPTPIPHDGPSASIPINFETGSTLVDEQTQKNVLVLATALADTAHPDQRYLFIGHADIRGVETNNVELSRRRAEAIREAVVMLQPSLQGRIDVTGRGSSEPVDTGRTESAYRANRRLQVLPVETQFVQ